MLNPFPQLLAYGFFVPMLLRITVALVFAYLAVQHFKNKKTFAEEISRKFKWVGHEMAVWLVGILMLGELLLGALLFVGAWVQLAAIFAALGFAKMSFFKKGLPSYAPLSRAAYFLLIVICLSLLVSGAGAFAFDLPL